MSGQEVILSKLRLTGLEIGAVEPYSLAGGSGVFDVPGYGSNWYELNAAVESPVTGGSGGTPVSLLNYTEFRIIVRVGIPSLGTGSAKAAFSLSGLTSEIDNYGENAISLTAAGVVSTDWEPIPVASRTLTSLFLAAWGTDDAAHSIVTFPDIYEFR